MFINHTVLSKSRLFAGIPIQDLQKAVACLHGFTKNFSQKEQIYKSFSKENLPGIVMSGQLCVTQIFLDGSSVLIKNINPGEMFGILEGNENCSANNEPYCSSSFITATEDTTVLFLRLPLNSRKTDSKQNFCSCKYRMMIMENLVEILMENNMDLNQKIRIISRPTIREKLLQFFMIQKNIQKSNVIKLDMTREKLAEFICCERSAVSRELSRMQKENLIEIEGKKICLLKNQDTTY